MCGRFFIPDQAVENAIAFLPEDLRAKAREAIADWAKELNRPRYDVRPTNLYPVITPRGVEAMRWGFITDKSNSVFNARKESLGWGLWRESLAMRRGLIVTGGFYEWTGEKGSKQAHAVHRLDGEPMVLGVLYDVNFEPKTEQEVNCFSIITTPASAWMQPLHDRQPLILDPQQAATWIDLTQKPPAIKALIQPYAGELAEFACASPKQDLPPRPGRRELF